MAQSSGVVPALQGDRLQRPGLRAGVTAPCSCPTRWACPAAAVTAFLDSFLRGNRDDAERKDDGSVLQALNLMNDSFVAVAHRGHGAAPTPIMLIDLDPTAMRTSWTRYFLGILSRYPIGRRRRRRPLAALAAPATARRPRAEPGVVALQQGGFPFQLLRTAMHGQDRFDRFVRRIPHPHRFFNRPHWTRREFFQAGRAESPGRSWPSATPAPPSLRAPAVSTRNTAQNVIFILLAGAPSHTDTFDFKTVAGRHAGQLRSPRRSTASCGPPA